MHINLNEECIQLIEMLSPLKAPVDKVAMGRFYEVSIDDKWYKTLVAERRVDEGWSETIMRLIYQSQRLKDIKS